MHPSNNVMLAVQARLLEAEMTRGEITAEKDRAVASALKAEEEAILTMSNAGTNINEDQDKDCSSSDDESSAPL